MKFSKTALTFLFILAAGFAPKAALAQVAGGLKVPPGCGDEMVAAPEECDDGNVINGDGCNIFCQIETPKLIFPVDTTCGDGAINTKDETCDDGNNLNGDGCDADCHAEINPIFPVEPECGNGIHVKGEECDDGNVKSGDGCDASCKIEIPNVSNPMPGTPPLPEANQPPNVTSPDLVQESDADNEEVKEPSHFEAEAAQFSMVGGGCSLVQNTPATSPWMAAAATIIFGAGLLSLFRRPRNDYRP